MITRVRFDDVLWETSDKKIQGKELQKFQKHINWCKDLPVVLAPAILCQDVDKFPGAVDYLRECAEEGIVFPDLHGWTHGPYGDMPYEEICEHLDQAMDWFDKNLPGFPPIRWVTPHGANSFDIQTAARNHGLIVEDTNYPVIDQKEADALLRKFRDPAKLDGRVIMVHWWERGLRLYRIAQILQHNGVDEAIIASKETLDDKSWKICWHGW
jgi:hypothetical protein